MKKKIPIYFNSYSTTRDRDESKKSEIIEIGPVVLKLFIVQLTRLCFIYTDINYTYVNVNTD